jgi:hypothetical protein
MKMKNRNLALEKSISFLSQPISIMAIFLLFLNDHLLRTHFQSWIFGKLGDFSWLFIFPPMLIILLSLLFRPKSLSHSNAIGLIAYGFTAFVFTLANLSMLFNTFILDILEIVFGRPAILVSDPTDIFALIALIVSWKMWDQHVIEKIPIRRGVITIPIIALLTIANSGLPDYGIFCVNKVDGVLYAASEYEEFKSTNGGMSWDPVMDNIPIGCDDSFFYQEDKDIKQIQVQSEDRFLTYRFELGGSIELSEDRGTTWIEVYPQKQNSEVEKTIYSARLYNVIPLEGPIDAVYDEEHGTITFAMSHQGVLVLDSTGKWNSIAVGEYVPYGSIPFTERLNYLTGELFVSLGIGLLLFQILSLSIIKSRRQKIIVLISCAIFMPCFLIFSPIYEDSYSGIIGFAGYMLSAILLPSGVLETITRLYKSFRKQIFHMFLFSFISSIIYFGLLVLWLAEVIPYYIIAQVSGLLYAMVLYFLWERKMSADSDKLEIGIK